MRNKLLVKYFKDLIDNFFTINDLPFRDIEELDRQIDDYIDKVIEQNTF